MHHQPPKNSHQPPEGHTDSQILAVLYQKIFEMDDRLFGDGATGELPQIRTGLAKVENFRSMCVGALKAAAAGGTLLGLVFAAIQFLKK